RATSPTRRVCWGSAGQRCTTCSSSTTCRPEVRARAAGQRRARRAGRGDGRVPVPRRVRPARAPSGARDSAGVGGSGDGGIPAIVTGCLELGVLPHVPAKRCTLAACRSLAGHSPWTLSLAAHVVVLRRDGRCRLGAVESGFCADVAAYRGARLPLPWR